jgi:hypothetical protein
MANENFGSIIPLLSVETARVSDGREFAFQHSIFPLSQN